MFIALKLIIKGMFNIFFKCLQVMDIQTLTLILFKYSIPRNGYLSFLLSSF